MRGGSARRVMDYNPTYRALGTITKENLSNFGNLMPNGVRTHRGCVLSDTSGRMRPLCSGRAEIDN